MACPIPYGGHNYAIHSEVTTWSTARYFHIVTKHCKPRMWANAQPDGHPAEHRWHPLFNAQSLADAYYLTAIQ